MHMRYSKSSHNDPIKYRMVTSRVKDAEKERTLNIKVPADRPPSDWNIEITAKGKNSSQRSRADVGGSQFVLCAIIKKK